MNIDKGSVTLGNGDEEILSEFDKSVNFVDGRYRVNLPWKPGMREALQHNKTVAQQYPHTFELLNSSIYVDDLICGQNDVRTLYVLPWSACKYSVTQACYCANGEVIRLWQQEGVKTESSETSAIDLRPPTKVLGLAWDQKMI
ncbi:uncharacterized protein TNCV_3367141 [Trichonephila clavipes]|nr:uncharacterized protein TNCV_3367141 [Trichonephila clavipes]